jgi:TatA/E family protein of Tat protein translocase
VNDLQIAAGRETGRCRRISGVPFDIGPWEIVILLAVLALLFGAKGVPEVARRLGVGVRELKDAVGEVDPRRMLEPGDDRPRTDSASKPEPRKDPEA